MTAVHLVLDFGVWVIERNDVIIDFYLKFVSREKLSQADCARTHIFSSFFYRRLTQKETRRCDDNTLS